MLSPPGIILGSIHLVIVVLWYALFFTDEPKEIPIANLVFVIDIPLLMPWGLANPDFVMPHGRHPYFMMTVAGTIWWWWIGMMLQVAWDRWCRHDV
jgi:hypothetical protein